MTTHQGLLMPQQSPPSSFVEFWRIYPRKVGKIAAERAWSKAVKRASAGEIVGGAEEFAESTGKWDPADRQFIPHPSTWLNGGRWDDDREEWKRREVERDDGDGWDSVRD